MATGGLGRDEVKAIEDKLECSPSASSMPAKSGGRAKLMRNSGNVAASGSTSEFKMERRSGKIPGYTSKFARGARQE
jgi:hypothetical protein